jgi:hypothetical protein
LPYEGPRAQAGNIKRPECGRQLRFYWPLQALSNLAARGCVIAFPV